MNWKHSRLRFYILNAKWNYKFWLLAEKTYKTQTYNVNEEEFNLESVDITGKMHFNTRKVTVKRFVGYRYENAMYLDNPGFRHTIDKETWKAWKGKGLIKQ